MCVSTCQVEFVLRELSFFILLPQRVDYQIFERLVLKRTVLLCNYTRAEGIENWLGQLL